MSDTQKPDLSVVDDGTLPEGDLTVQDIIDQANDQPHRTILEVWRELLNGSDQVRHERITPQWALRITSKYRELNFTDMVSFRDLYFTRLDDLRSLLTAAIDSDDECLNQPTPEEDRTYNAERYLNLLIDWQREILGWELSWGCTSADAAIEIAVMGELHEMLFGQVGMTSLLDQINFEMSDADRDFMAGELQALLSGAPEGGSGE